MGSGALALLCAGSGPGWPGLDDGPPAALPRGLAQATWVPLSASAPPPPLPEARCPFRPPPPPPSSSSSGAPSVSGWRWRRCRFGKTRQAGEPKAGGGRRPLPSPWRPASQGRHGFGPGQTDKRDLHVKAAITRLCFLFSFLPPACSLTPDSSRLWVGGAGPRVRTGTGKGRGLARCPLQPAAHVYLIAQGGRLAPRPPTSLARASGPCRAGPNGLRRGSRARLVPGLQVSD